jgi:hypothetical protein
MSKTPLRSYLDETGQSAEVFASEKGLSPWSVRHWSRGDKLPELAKQIRLEEATDGAVTPGDWLAWDLARRPAQEAA